MRHQRGPLICLMRAMTAFQSTAGFTGLLPRISSLTILWAFHKRLRHGLMADFVLLGPEVFT